LGLLPVLVALLLMAGLPSVRTAHADPSTGSMHVVVPTPSSDGKTVQGPVHTNVSVSASQATAGATYSLGWATTTAGCATGFTAFTSVAPVTADAGGGFSATFVWPTAAGNPGALYFICASDTANPTTNVITADQVFQVLGSAAPQITLAQAPSATATATGKTFYAGGPVQVRGKSFLPVGTMVDIFVTSSATFSPSDFQPDNALKTLDNSQIISDSQGQFTANVLLPDIITGQLFLYAVSTDAVPNGPPTFPPSLVASRTIQISAPLPTPTAQPSPTPTGKGNGGDNTANGSGQTTRIVAIAALGGLSLVLFIIGGILIASAALGSGKPPTANGGARSQPDGARSDPRW
jgi:hypothetical protein